MAENNSSAPLKTAGEPFVALGECIADQVCLSVAELPDRDSPADWPQAMLVTSDELRNIVLNAINYAAQAVAAQAAPAAVAVPPAVPGLSGDAALAHEQCRAVVHLALAVAEVYSSNALIVARDSRLAEQIGAASAEVMEYLGDTLNSTDATTEDDEWLEPIFEGAQERWPAANPPTLAASDRPQVPRHIGQLIDAYGASRADEDGQSGTRIGELVSALRDWAASIATPALPATEDSSAGDLAEGHPWKDHMTAQLVNQLVSVAKQFHGAQQLRERIAGLIRPLADRVKAEVQAEPVAWRWVSLNGKPAGTHCFPMPGPSEGAVRLAAAAEPPCTVQYLRDHTAPQAQPADALDAAARE